MSIKVQTPLQPFSAQEQQTEVATLNPDYSEAQRFLKLLDPSASDFTFQTFDDTQKRKDKALARISHGSLIDQFVGELPELNMEGAGVFVTINETDLLGRRTENIKRMRAIWQDDDKGFSGTYPLAPSIIVQSSPGKFQRYWLVDGLGFEEFDGVMARIVKEYGCDRSAADCTRVLRLPGFYHRKADPHLVRIVEASGRRYSREEILQAFPPMRKPLPEALRAVLRPAGAAVARRVLVDEDETRSIAAATQWLQESAPPAIQGMNGDNTTVYVAMALAADYALSEDVALGLMLEHYNPRCIPPWDPEELAVKVANGQQYAKGDRGTKTPAYMFGAVQAVPPAPLLVPAAPPALPVQDTQTSEKQTRFRMVPPDEIKPVLSGNWRIKGLMPAQGLMTVYAPPGAGKSFLTLAAVLHVAAGVPFAARKTKQAGVVYIVGEGKGGFRNRLLKAAEHLDISLSKIPFRLIEDTPNLGVSEGDREWLEARVEEQTAALGWTPGIVVIDTLASTMHGADENNAQGMGAFIANAEGLAQKFGCLVIAVHHVGKDETRGMRGWSGLHAACDCEWEVTKGTGEGSYSVSLQKVREGLGGLSWSFNLPVVVVGRDEDGDEVTTRVVEITSEPAIASSATGERQRAKSKSGCLIAFDAAFDGAMAAAGEDYTTAGGAHVKAVLRSEVRSRFLWVADEPDARKRQKRVSDAFSRALEGLPEQGEYQREIAGGLERIWRAAPRKNGATVANWRTEIVAVPQIGIGDQSRSEGAGCDV